MSAVIQAKCPHCQKILRIPSGWLDQTMRCKHCQQVFQVNAKKPRPAVPTASAAATPAGPQAIRPATAAPARSAAAPAARPAPAAAVMPQASSVSAAPSFAAQTMPAGGDPFAFDEADAPAAEGTLIRTNYKRRSRWPGLLIGLGTVAVVAVALVFAGPQLLNMIDAAAKKNQHSDEPLRVVRLNTSSAKGSEADNTVDASAPVATTSKDKAAGAEGKPRPRPFPNNGGGNNLFPRRALAISVNDYLLANSLHYGYNPEQGFPGSSSRAVLDAFGRFTLKFPNTQLYELSDYARQEHAPLKSVIEQTITDFCQGSRNQDRIIVLFTGHALETEDKVYLVPIEGDLEDPTTLIPLQWVYDQLKASPARQKVLILDVCRFDPARGRERPGGEPMGKLLDMKLQNPPEGVQVWSSCLLEQQSYEFERGSLFLEALCASMAERLVGFQNPTDPLPLDQLFPRVNSYLQKRLESLKLKQTSRLVGTEPASGAAYNPSEALAKLEIKPPTIKGGTAGKAVVSSVLSEINAAPPTRVGRPGSSDGFRFSALPPFSAAILDDYKVDGYNDEDEFLKKEKEFPLRAAIVRAKHVLRDNAKTFEMREYFSGGGSAKVKEAIAKEQEKPGKAIFFIEEAMDELAAKEPLLEKETSKRWKAHYEYVMARMQARLIYLLEYSYVLGLIRRDILPELMGDATGYRLGSITKPSTNEAKVRDWRRDLKKRWDSIIENYPSTPWALLARREKETALGLEWRLSRE